MLFTIEDDTYNYLFDRDINIFCEDMKYDTLLNIFSGSGRLVKQLAHLGISRKFKTIYNIDSSREMIEFEKKFLHEDNTKFVCQNFFDIETSVYQYNAAVCHCGLRYVDKYEYDKFLKKLLVMKRDNFAKSIITEINDEIIGEIIRILDIEKIKFTHIRRLYHMQRNTTLYLSLKYYEDDKTFRELVSNISTQSKKHTGDILKEISGFKTSDMHIIIF
ncbi:MAG: class I SAM-dependent methyltransferase [Synergistaceae bacterium]|nr:class I SAM-dependent methyltransferase [Synergistaceae bacterium]